MKLRFQILALRAAIVVVGLPLKFTSATSWRLENLWSRLQTKLANLQADEQRHTR